MKRLVLVLCLGTWLGGAPLLAQLSDPDLARGVRLVEQGEYAQAIVVLDELARKLHAADRKPEAARAYLYLGIAYVAEGQESLARASLREALVHDPRLDLSAFEVSPKVREVFQQAKDELAQRTAAEPKKGGSKAPLLVLGGLAVAGAGVAVAASGGAFGGEQLTVTFTFRDFRGNCSTSCEYVLGQEVTFQPSDSGGGGTPRYAWDFGDGTTETAMGEGAPPVRHTYTLAGTFTVTVTLTRGGQSATDRHPVTIRALTGTWDGSSAAGGPFVAIMTQNGATVSGTIEGAALTGNLDKMGNIFFRLDCPRGSPTFAGFAETVNRITGSGTLPCSAFNQGSSSYTMTRRQ